MSIKDKIKKLAVSITNKSDIEIVDTVLKDCNDYVLAVANMERSTMMNKFLLEGQDYRDSITALDKYRRACHNSAIVGVKIINKLCNLYDVEAVFDGNIEDRIEVANFCINLINELFEERAI